MRTHQPEAIVPIILAAGSSKLLGSPKPLARFGSRTTLQIAIENCRNLGRRIVVLGCNASKIAPHAPPDVTITINRNWRDGQLSSLLSALAFIPKSAAFMLYPVDHPLLDQSTVDALAAAFRNRNSKQHIAMPKHKNRLGHPIIVSAKLRQEFLTAETAREIVYGDPARNLVLPVSTSSIYEDFSTPESYRECLRKFKHLDRKRT
ncbi:MAG TPA: nucleotidyltransferase family protein [Candidatus Acidoferrum sp.]